MKFNFIMLLSLTLMLVGCLNDSKKEAAPEQMNEAPVETETVNEAVESEESMPAETVEQAGEGESMEAAPEEAVQESEESNSEEMN